MPRVASFTLLALALSLGCSSPDSPSVDTESDSNTSPNPGTDSQSNDGSDSDNGTGNPDTDTGTGTGSDPVGTGSDTETDTGEPNDELPVIADSFPESGKAAAGGDVQLSFLAPETAGALLQCRTAHVLAFSSSVVPWVFCDGDDGTGLSAQPGPTSNGLTRTEVRLLFADSTPGESVSIEYYVHDSLDAAASCASKATNSEYFTAAATKLPHTLEFPTETDLRNPFVHLPFAPPISATFGILETDGLAEPLSLRRRFVLNEDRTMLLVTRTYASRRVGANDRCEVGSVKVHRLLATKPDHYSNHCDALVFNALGAAACLYVDLAGDVLFRDNGASFNIYPFSAAGIDHFLWRKMFSSSHDWFSAKCFASPTCAVSNPDMLYLPDHNLF